jgi:hypothetical protein
MRLTTLTLALAGLFSANAMAQDLNLYSSRHYQTDEALYSGFTKATGIKLNRIEAGERASKMKAPPRPPMCWSPWTPAVCGAPNKWACSSRSNQKC